MDCYGWRLESIMPTLVGGGWNRPFWDVKKSHFNGHLHPLNALKIYIHLVIHKGKVQRKRGEGIDFPSHAIELLEQYLFIYFCRRHCEIG